MVQASSEEDPLTSGEGLLYIVRVRNKLSKSGLSNATVEMRVQLYLRHSSAKRFHAVAKIQDLRRISALDRPVNELRHAARCPCGHICHESHLPQQSAVASLLCTPWTPYKALHPRAVVTRLFFQGVCRSSRE